MKLLVPLAALGLLLTATDIHPQSYDRGPAPPMITGAPEAPPPPADGPPRRMICIIDTPFPNHEQRCETHTGYPGSPCRCEGSLFEGERVLLQ